MNDITDDDKTKELVDVVLAGIGNLLEFNTGIVIHEEDASYVIANQAAEDDEGEEMFSVSIMKYEPDDDYVSQFPHGIILEIPDMDIKSPEDTRPSLKLVH